MVRAVVKTGGKQYRVSVGDRLKVEQLAAAPGTKVTLDQVLLVVNGESVILGTPHIDKAKVQATVIGHGRTEKVRIFKMKRRKHHRKQQGHRQSFTEIQIDSVDT
jgi:large subunit ribosomal protein L21